jgi:hypothetical protein
VLSLDNDREYLGVYGVIRKKERMRRKIERRTEITEKGAKIEAETRK